MDLFFHAVWRIWKMLPNKNEKSCAQHFLRTSRKNKFITWKFLCCYYRVVSISRKPMKSFFHEFLSLTMAKIFTINVVMKLCYSLNWGRFQEGKSTLQGILWNLGKFAGIQNRSGLRKGTHGMNLCPIKCHRAPTGKSPCSHGTCCWEKRI